MASNHRWKARIRLVRTIFLLVTVAVVAFACGDGDDSDAGSTASVVPTGIRALTYTWSADDGSALDREYLLYVPEDYTTEESWPLVLYLHGGPGPETIDDIATTDLVAVVELLPYRFVMIAPLATVADMTTTNTGAWLGWADYLIDLVDHVDEDLSIDRDRIYFTGHSLGGTGVWQLALAKPDVPAALLPMSGRWEWSLPASLCDIAGIPTRVVHGPDDSIVPFADAERMIAGLRECGGEVIFDILDGFGHQTVWTTFRDRAVVDWLLAQGAEGAWPALPETGSSLDDLVEIETTLSDSGATFEVITGADALECGRGMVLDDPFQFTGFSRSFHCESGERSGSGFTMYLVPDTSEWSITAGTGGFEGVEASGFSWPIFSARGVVRGEIITGEIGRAAE